jgi:Cu+-exporting ATPase
MNKKVLKIEGMDCNNCALGLKKQLQKLEIKEVDVVFATGEVLYESAGKKDDQVVSEKIKAMGYEIVEGLEEEGESKRSFWTIGRKFWISLIFTIPLLSAMVLPFPVLHHPWLQLSLTIPVFALGLWHFGRSGIRSLMAGVPNMDVLILLGSTAAFVYSLIGMIMEMGHKFLFFETTASIITLIFLGNYLEHIAVKRTTDAVDSLVQLQRTTAHRVVRDPKTGISIQDVDANKVKIGDILEVRLGEKIPVDGEITEGEGSIDESMISGESVPVEKSRNESIIGGTVLMAGHLRMRATAIGKETVLAQIIELVKSAQQDKPRLQTLADKISAVFVPVVTGIAILTFLLSHFVFDIGLQHALMNSIAVLVIACPCALGLAIPTAVVVAVGRVAKNGILIKGASTLQKMLQVRYIAFDKTGTLTTGAFKIREMHTFGNDATEARNVLFSLESHSSHPIAISLAQELSGSRMIHMEGIEEKKGLGIGAKDDDGNQWFAGSYRSLQDQGMDNRHDILLLKNGKLFAAVDLEDEIKAGAEAVIDYFKHRDITPVLISGDRREKCEALASRLSISDVYYEKLPAEKLVIIDQLEKSGGVIMVGDGVNDAPALTRAGVGISLSNATHAAIQSSQVILLKGNMHLLTRAFSISRLTVKVIKQNLFWAFFYNVIAIPIAAFGFLDPMIAAATMAFSDVVVVLNSLRLRTKRLD